MYDILLLNPPQSDSLDFVRVGTPAKYSSDCINPGLLCIATYLESKGFETKIVDLSQQSGLDIRKQIKSAATDGTPMCVGISSASGFDYLEALDVARAVKQEFPESLCIAGGQHIGPLGKVALSDCEALDVVAEYEGEIVAEQILSRLRKKQRDFENIPGIVFRKNGKILETVGTPLFLDINDLPPLKFDLYPNFKRFLPFVEESRGCSFSCRYCTNAFIHQKRVRIRKAKNFVKELDNTISFFGTKSMYAFLASIFGLDVSNTLEIAEEVKKRNIRWTTESRVDLPWRSYITKLYESGVLVYNVGLESASPRILIEMNKTNNPGEYLKMARDLIETVSRMDGLDLGVNIMPYVGDTPETIGDTLKFVEQNAYGIHLLSATMLFVNPGTQVFSEFERYRKSFGSELLMTDYTMKRHFFPCKVSKYFSFEETAYLCSALEKIFTKEQVHELYATGDYRKYSSLATKKYR